MAKYTDRKTDHLPASALEEHPLYAGALFRQAGVFQAFLHSPAPVRTVPVIAISARTAKHEAHLCGQLTLCVHSTCGWLGCAGVGTLLFHSACVGTRSAAYKG